MSLSIDAAISGMVEQQRNIELIANNLANVNSAGYKRAKIHFQDVLNTAAVFSSLSGGGEQQPASSAGVATAGITRDFSQGSLQPSGRDMDFAISGDGFFRVKLDDGSYAYTRAGMFTLDGSGRVVTVSGEVMDPALQLPPRFRDLRVDDVGVITVTRDLTQEELDALGPYDPRDGKRIVAGQMTLFRFPNPTGLAAIGNSRFKATPESQEAIEGKPGDEGMGVVYSGWLEASNVDIATEMTGLVIAKRGYQLNLVAYKTIEEMLSKVNQVV
ncbi:MAG: flagellar hook basal-body protein [Dehalococcoidia bacterium]|nr:MAG: flagellar hook basal-body protein [Dehalococcoidia bacterium]